MEQLLNLGFLDYALIFGLIGIGAFYLHRKNQNKNEFDEATIRGFNMVPVQDRQQETNFITKMKSHVCILILSNLCDFFLLSFIKNSGSKCCCILWFTNWNSRRIRITFSKRKYAFWFESYCCWSRRVWSCWGKNLINIF